MNHINNHEFIKYTAQRYGIDENTVETMVDIFASALHEIIHAGASVTIDEIGEFSTRLVAPDSSIQKQSHFSKGISSKLAVTFKPSNKLLEEVA